MIDAMKNQSSLEPAEVFVIAFLFRKLETKEPCPKTIPLITNHFRRNRLVRPLQVLSERETPERRKENGRNRLKDAQDLD
jgi:hypothetical protein